MQPDKKIKKLSTLKTIHSGAFTPAGITEDKIIFHQEEYDTAGNKIKDVIYDENGIEEQESTYYYDEKNRLTRRVIRFFQDELEEEQLQVFENNMLTEKHHIYADGSRSTKKITSDEEGNPVKIVNINDEGEIEETEEFLYEKQKPVKISLHSTLTNELQVQTLRYDTRGRLEYVERPDESTGEMMYISYNYDKHEENPDYTIRNSEGKVVEALRKFYDENNRLVKQEVQLGGSRLKKFTTTMTYNEKGAMVMSETLDEKDELVRRVSSFYSEDGRLEQEVFQEHEVSRGYIQNFSHHYVYEFHPEPDS